MFIRYYFVFYKVYIYICRYTGKDLEGNISSVNSDYPKDTFIQTHNRETLTIFLSSISFELFSISIYGFCKVFERNLSHFFLEKQAGAWKRWKHKVKWNGTQWNWVQARLSRHTNHYNSHYNSTPALSSLGPMAQDLEIKCLLWSHQSHQGAWNHRFKLLWFCAPARGC